MAETIHRSQLRITINRKLIDLLSEDATKKEMTLSAFVDELLSQHYSLK